MFKPRDCYYSRINQGDVRPALQRMGRNKAVGPDQIPIEAWSEVIPIYKNKGDAQACSNYRGINLLNHTMKLWERVIERRPKKAYDSVPRELVWRTLRDNETPMRYSRVIKDMYEGFKTRVRTIMRNTEFFLRASFGIVLIAESAKELNNIIKRLREALEENDLRVSKEKTEYLRCDFGMYEVVHQEVDIRIGDRILQPKEYFRYLGSVIHRSGRIDEDVAHRIGVECWPITKAQANRVEVAELRMLRWTYGITMVDMIPNGVFRVELDVDSIIDKMREE
nr:retrovirus-related Pol polyprotein LINE-1 [Tanacetum cinerariifolium]